MRFELVVDLASDALPGLSADHRVNAELGLQLAEWRCRNPLGMLAERFHDERLGKRAIS